VLACNLALNRAEAEPERAEAQLRAAAIADPLSFEPLLRLAVLESENWRRYPSAPAFERTVAYFDKAIRLNPRSASLQEQKGDVCVEVYRQARDEDALAVAVRAYRRTTELHPSSIMTRAKLALVLADAGDKRGAAAEAEEAIRLNDLTPHADQKLPADVLHRLKSLATAEN
jgi:tetratricopeptide (TPR) repeat protein